MHRALNLLAPVEWFRQQRGMWIILTAFISLITFIQGQEIRSTCNIPAVQKGIDTAITCNFSDDLSKEQKDVVVKHYVSGKDELVLACEWAKGKIECHVRPTYVFDGTITNTLRILIPEATEDHIGNYSCYVIHEEENQSPCTFNLTVIESECDAPAVEQGEGARITCKFSHDLTVNHYEISVKHYAAGKDENVILCMWEDGKEKCHIRPTYEFHGEISDKLSIEIPYATQDHNGLYVCYVTPAEEGHFKGCNFSINDRAPTIPTEIFHTTFPTTFNGSFENSESENRSEKNELTLLWLISLGAVLPLIVILLYCRKKKSLCFREKNPPKGNKQSTHSDDGQETQNLRSETNPSKEQETNPDDHETTKLETNEQETPNL